MFLFHWPGSEELYDEMLFGYSKQERGSNCRWPPQMLLENNIK